MARDPDCWPCNNVGGNDQRCTCGFKLGEHGSSHPHDIKGKCIAFDLIDCDVCQSHTAHSHPRDYMRRFCVECGVHLGNHGWAIHPHYSFEPSVTGRPCPGFTEVLDESFED